MTCSYGIYSIDVLTSSLHTYVVDSRSRKHMPTYHVDTYMYMCVGRQFNMKFVTFQLIFMFIIIKKKNNRHFSCAKLELNSKLSKLVCWINVSGYVLRNYTAWYQSQLHVYTNLPQYVRMYICVCVYYMHSFICMYKHFDIKYISMSINWSIG